MVAGPPAVRGLPYEVNAVQVKVSVRHGVLGDEPTALVREKAEKLLHFFDRLMLIEVTIDLAGLQKGVEIIATAEHKHTFVGHAHDPDLLHAAVLAVDKVKQQIKHYKEKIQDHRNDPPHAGTKV